MGVLHNSIMNGPYVRRIIPEPRDPARTVPAIQTILLGLPKDIYAAVDSCETAQEIWLRVQQMMKGSDIGIQEKKAMLFNEWERFTSTDGESIESYYHRFSKLMNDFKRNKYFPKKIASNLKFLNNLQPEWSRHVTIVHQTKDLHIADYTQLYDFLKYNQKDVDELRAERLAKTQDPLALMANSNNSFKYPVFYPDLLSSSTYIQQPLPNNKNYIPQPSFNQNYMQQPMPNLKDITDPTTAMNTTLALMAKAFKLNYSTPTNNNPRISSNPRNRQIAQPWNQVVQNAVQNPGVQNVRNQNGVIVVPGIAHQNGNGNVVAVWAEGNANGNTAEEFDLMAAAADLDKIEEVNANCILMANLQQASALGTQTDKAPVYDSDGLVEVQLYDKCYNDEIFNMFTQEEQYTELLEPIPEPHQVPQNDSNVISEVSSVEQGRGTVEQHHVTIEETHAYQESSLLNLVTEVEKVNMVNCKMREKKNAKLTTEFARCKNQEKCFEISQEKYDKLESCYQQSVYQEQCLTKKINALHSSSEAAKFIRDFQSLANEADESLAMNKALELEIERLLRAVENEYAKLWNDWYKKCKECKYDKISYDKAYNDMHQKIKLLQAQLGDQKSKSKDTPYGSNTLDPLPQRLENENVELEFQNKLHDTIYENAKLTAQLFDKNASKTQIPQKVDKTHDLSNPVTSNSVPTTKESKVVDNDKVIALECLGLILLRTIW
ncbi:hypothetical protein Tco_0631927 [Tanacetum coccineum]